MAGVFVTRGMRLQIPEGGLTISLRPDGALDSTMRLQVTLDMCPYWLEIAVAHLSIASKARNEGLEARARADDAGVGTSLEREFSSGMQAITSAAIALDALYATVRDRTSIPQNVVDTWRRKRTARHRQVSEVFRRAFRVRPRGFSNLSQAVAEVFRFRDLAVHPPARFTDPVHHSRLGAATEWRFVSFGYESAYTAVRATLAMVVQLARAPRHRSAPFTKYCSDLAARLEALVASWRAEFGALTDAPTPPSTATTV